MSYPRHSMIFAWLQFHSNLDSVDISFQLHPLNPRFRRRTSTKSGKSFWRREKGCCSQIQHANVLKNVLFDVIYIYINLSVYYNSFIHILLYIDVCPHISHVLDTSLNSCMYNTYMIVRYSV